MTGNQATSVALCVITYRRPQGLQRLLRALGRLETGEGTELSVVVVDNDPAEGARAVVEACRPLVPWALHYEVEPTRGISYARNRAMRLALEQAPAFVAWMDDDEEPDPRWLIQVLETQARTGADVVMTPSIPIFEPGAPDWVQRSGLLEGERFLTGEPYPYFHTRTSAVLIRSCVVPVEGFDERLALTGGEDRMFFTRIHRAGGQFVWDDRAVVRDYIPASRARLGWMFRRWYRTGVTRSLVMLYLDEPSRLRRARRVAGGLVGAARGLALTVMAVPRGRVQVLRRWRLVLIGIGASAGALGISYQEYRATHGA
jgi:succinoglycan biosynthesis protein ExoM